MDFVEKQHSHVRLNRKYKILEKTHKGSVKMIQDTLIHAFKTKEKGTDEDIAKVLGGFAPLATENPESLIGQLNTQHDQSDTVKQTEVASDRLSGITLNTQPTKKGLIEEINSEVKSLPEPVYELSITSVDDTAIMETITVKISLPGVRSVAECELDISKVNICLRNYGKCPKISNTLLHTFWLVNCVFYAVVSLNTCGVANSIDPDQTAPFDLDLHCLHKPFCQKVWCAKC